MKILIVIVGLLILTQALSGCIANKTPNTNPAIDSLKKVYLGTGKYPLPIKILIFAVLGG